MEKLQVQRPDIDRGWAWVVMAAAFLGVIVTATVGYMSGVIFVALMERYDKGETKTSLVGAISSGLLSSVAPFAGIINNRYSCRTSIFLGGFLTTVGSASSAFAPSLDWIIFTAGVVLGLGQGLSVCGLFCVLGFYFERWRNTALSTAFLLVGIAMLGSAPFALFLIAEHSLTVTFLVIACIEAQVCVIGAICKPSSLEEESHDKKRAQRTKKASRSKLYIDISVVKNVSFMCFLLSTTAWNFAMFVAITHLPNYVIKLGGSYRDIGLLMSSFSVANVIGRLCGSLTISKLPENSIYVHVAVLGVTGILTSMFVLYSDFKGGSYLFTIQLGLFTGWPNALMAPLSLSFTGVEKISEAVGLSLFFSGIGVSFGPVIIGYIYSATGSYENSFIVAGAVLIVGCLFGCVSACIKRKTDQEIVNKKMKKWNAKTEAYHEKKDITEYFK